MPTFPMGYTAHKAHVENAKLIEQLVRDSGAEGGKRRRRRGPASVTDPRGVPIIGQGCGRGAIRGSTPGANLR